MNKCIAMVVGCATLAALMFGAATVSAEVRIGTVDLEKIRKESPRFQKASKEIGRMVEDFESRRDRMRAELERLAENLQNAGDGSDRSAFEQQRREMAEKSRAFQEFMEETFGTDGIIEVRSSELLAPLYADLADAGSKVAKSMGLDLILDLEQVNPLFASDRLDVTDKILDEFLDMR